MMIENDEEFEVHNRRRHELIDEKFFGGGLNCDQRDELKRLQGECREYINKLYPIDFAPLEEAARFLEENAARLERLCEELGLGDEEP